MNSKIFKIAMFLNAVVLTSMLFISPVAEVDFNSLNQETKITGYVIVQTYSHTETYEEQVATAKTIVFDHIETYQEQIGFKQVSTGNYKRTTYLGRYVYKETKVTDNDYEYVYAAKQNANICDEECHYTWLYAYDVYARKEETVRTPVYITKKKDVYKELVTPIYETKKIDVYKKVVKPVYRKEIVNNPVGIIALKDKVATNNYANIINQSYFMGVINKHISIIVF